MTVKPPLPLGQAENDKLEFKAADVLMRPAKVAREVVAFLNADGGELWIGIEETNGFATAAQDIANPDASRDSLWNHLVDTIEPSPTNDEVRSETVGGVIRIEVRKGKRRPYCLRKDQGWQFPLRVGARIRDMDRQEVADAFVEGHADVGTRAREEDQPKRDLSDSIHKRVKEAKTGFWWRLVPIPKLHIDFEDAGAKKFLQLLLTDPRESGNRRTGWTMVFADHDLPRVVSSGVAHRFGSGDVRHEVTIDTSGAMTFLAPRARLDRKWNADGTDIFPFALLELPVSGFRMAAKLLKQFASKPHSHHVICGAVIGGIKGVKLRSGSPLEPELPWKPARAFENSDLIVSPPFQIEMDQLIKAPDAAAYRLVRRIYEEFGFDETDIPQEFDAKDKILRFDGNR